MKATDKAALPLLQASAPYFFLDSKGVRVVAELWPVVEAGQSEIASEKLTHLCIPSEESWESPLSPRAPTQQTEKIRSVLKLSASSCLEPRTFREGAPLQKGTGRGSMEGVQGRYYVPASSMEPVSQVLLRDCQMKGSPPPHTSLLSKDIILSLTCR